MAAREQFAYERIESRIESLIAGGTLAPGDRVPSVREICRDDCVSPATAVQALANLEAKALIQARPRSGFYVQAPSLLPLPKSSASLPGPQIPKISEHVARVFHDLDSPEAIPLGAGVPDPALLPNDEIARCISRASRQYAADFGSYANSGTDIGLRRELALRLSRTGCPVSPDEIIITNGCLDALNLALRAVANPGDTVLVESPTFFGILQMIESLGMKALSIPSTCDAGLDLEAFERAANRYRIAAIILIPTFGNPHGASLDDARRKSIVRIAAKKNIPLIEDEVYADLAFDHSRPRPLKSCGEASGILLCGSLSKTLSPSLRVGWVAAGRFAEDVRRLKWISCVTIPHVTVRAAFDYLRSGGFDRHLRGFRKILEIQMARISGAIASHFPQGTAISRPGGGYFLWVELPWRVNAFALRDAASRHGISICPGPLFSPHGEFEHFIRINCALQWTRRVEKAIQTLGRLARDLNQ